MNRHMVGPHGAVKFLGSLALLSLIASVHIASAQERRIADEHRTESTVNAEAIFTRPVTVSLKDVSLKTAVRAIAASAGIQIQYESKLINTITKPVTVHAERRPLGEILDLALAGTKLIAIPVTGDQLLLKAARNVSIEGSGEVTGKVLDAKTRQPLGGVTILIDDEARGVTGINGQYTIQNVPVGTHTVTARLIGHGKQRQSIIVNDGLVSALDFTLEGAVAALEQVVVTGTVIQTELKAVPNAMTIITAKQIEERGVTKIDQLFHGDIPGLFAQNQGSNALLDEVTMFSRGATKIGAYANDLNITNPIKTYIDGVELADAKYLSQIDPKSIERIEILTGPQASTIYGSNAINGVMQIFTKRGSTAKPQLTLNLLSGFVQNNFSSTLTPQHDYSGQLSGIEGRLSYNAGGSWNYMGPWTPAKQTTRMDGFGGARLDLPTSAGRVTADMTLRRGLTQNLQRGNGQQTPAAYQETGWYTIDGVSGLSVPKTSTLTGQTLGLVLSYAPASWWSHELGLGQDASDTEQRYTARGYKSVSDTTLWLDQIHADRRSLRYATTARIPIASLAQATVTAGADAWQTLSSEWSVSPQTLTGPLTGSTGVSRQPGHNTGGFLQSQVDLKDRLFFTYGLRAEWNPDYGAAAEPNYAHRYGIAYTQEQGSVTAKLRASYGRSTRPPTRTQKAGSPVTTTLYFGSYANQLPNPNLGPEYQQGGEGGIELYFGNRTSLNVTWYNQTVDGLIAHAAVDSVDELPVWKAFYGDADWQYKAYQYQNLNIGSVRNQGWELRGRMNTGPFTTRGTYSWTKSRTIGVDARYHAFFANQPQYQPGATFLWLPEHTWAFGVTYAHATTTVGLNLTGTGRAAILNDDFFFRSLNGAIRLPQNRLNMRPNDGTYISFNNPYALADLTASHRFLPRVEGVLEVQNLTDRYTNDYYAAYASLGRQSKLGVRIR